MIRLAHILGIVGTLLLAIPAQANETLTYDANGNIQSRTLPGGTTQYGYDDLDRLTSETGPAKTQSLTYDPNDNRLSDGSGNKTYTANTNQLATVNGQTVTRDKAGNITLIRGLSLEWNQAGQLKTVKQGSTQLATYYYDYKGRRSRKVTPTETTIYIYDLSDQLMVEFDGQGNPLRTYVWADDHPVAIIVHGTPERVIYLETDHLNTPIAARDEQAKLIWKWESDAFGSTLPNEDPDKDGVKTTINLRFPGQFYDKESGFHYNHHRYYDPQTGRYLSSDLIGLVGGINLYAYVEGNPLSYTDPLGLAGQAPGAGPYLPGEGPGQSVTDFLINGLVVAQKVWDASKLDGLAPEESALMGAVIGSLKRVSTAARACPELTGGGKRVLGNLSNMADKTVAEAIRLRGGNAANVGRLESGIGQRTLAEVANDAATGDAAAIQAVKMVKQAATKGERY